MTDKNPYLVLDASATIPLLLKTRSPLLPAVTEALLEAAIVYVPTLHGYEVANALWKYVAAKQLEANDAQRALNQSFSLATEIEFDQDLLQETLAIANQHRHPVHDSAYVALARRKSAALLSLDRRLCKLAEAAGIRVATA